MRVATTDDLRNIVSMLCDDIIICEGIFAVNMDFLHNPLPQVPSIIKEAVFGIIAGLIAVGAVTVIKKIISSFRKTEIQP